MHQTIRCETGNHRNAGVIFSLKEKVSTHIRMYISYLSVYTDKLLGHFWHISPTISVIQFISACIYVY